MSSEQLIQIAISIAERIATACIVVLAGRYLARLARRLLRRMLAEPRLAESLGPSIVRLLTDVAYYGLILLTFATALVTLGLPVTALFTASTAVLVVGGLALQQSLSNFAATVIFLLFQPFRRGELIETMGQTGTVQEILFFNTVLLTGDQHLVSLPNSKIQESGIINYSRMTVLQAKVTLSVTYDENLDHVRATLLDVLRADERVAAAPPPEVAVLDLGDSGIRIEARAIVGSNVYGQVLSDLRAAIKARFDAEGIAFLPQRESRPPDAPPAAAEAPAAEPASLRGGDQQQVRSKG